MGIIGELLKNSQAVVAATVTGLVTILVALIQNVIQLNKNKTDEKNRFEDTLKEKLEKVYNPIIVSLSKNKKNTYIIDKSILNIFNQNGHLLSENLFNDLKKLYEIEIDIKNKSKVSNDQRKEHENLKNRFTDILQKEYAELQSIYNRSFVKYTKKLNTKWYSKTVRNIVLACIISTVSFYFIAIAEELIKNINNTKILVIKNNITLNTIVVFYFYIMILTTLFGLGWLFMRGIENLIKIISKIKKMYKYGDYIPKTGLYKCSLCNKEEWLNKYGQFPICNHKTKIQKNFFKIFYIDMWKFISNKREIRRIDVRRISIRGERYE